MAETARENQVSSAAVKYETVADMGSGLVIAKVKLTDFREQDINARIMKTEMQKQLTDNIKKRGQLESLPFCALIDGKIEIISGHHRIRSAKDSGVLTELFVILDTTGLRRSQVAAKQLAHNAISGFDDQSTLKDVQLHGHQQLIADVDLVIGQDEPGVQPIVDELLNGSRDHSTAPPSGRMERMWHLPAPKMASISALKASSFSSGTKACTVPAKPPP